MHLARIGQASTPPARPRPRASIQGRDGAPQSPRVRLLGQTPSPRELKQQLLETLLGGANANRVREIAQTRPDLMDAASTDQRSRMTRTLLDKFFFGSADRQAILAVLRPAGPLGELPGAARAVKAAGRLANLFKQMGDVDEGLAMARLGLLARLYDDLAVVEDMGTTGVKALVRVATDEHLDALSREAKLTMIGILQAGPQDDETEVITRRLRNHLN